MGESELKTGLNGTSGFRMPWFGLPSIAFDEIAEAQQEGFEKIKAMSEDMADALHAACSSNGTVLKDYGLKLIEMSKANTASAIDFVSHLLGSKSVTDVLSLSATETRKAFEAAAAQNRELRALARRLAGEPVGKQAAELFPQAS